VRADSDFDKWFFAASKLFHEIQTEIGLDGARRIFTMVVAPSTARQRAGWKNMELLALYDCMMPRSNVQMLARDLAEKNKKLPKENRYGPRGSTDPLALDKQIRRLIAKRTIKQRAYRSSRALKRAAS
jgi:hypothetical protein